MRMTTSVPISEAALSTRESSSFTPREFWISPPSLAYPSLRMSDTAPAMLLAA